MTGWVMLTTDAVGGVWRYSVELAGQFSQRGIGVLFVVMGPAPNGAQRREAREIPGLRLIGTDLPLDWLASTPHEVCASARQLARLAAVSDAGTVHLHSPALIGDAEWTRPTVAVAHSCVATWWQAVHGDALPRDLVWRAAMMASGLQQAGAVIAPSRSFAAALVARYGVIRPIDVVWNGRRSSGACARNDGHVFTAGRLWDPGKNIKAIDAAAALLDVPIVAAGPLVAPHGACLDCHHLQCLGPLDDSAMADQYASAGIFVSMSYYEPFGLAVLEAAQAGCALILSDIPTFRELWDGAAIFVDPSDPPALAAAVRKCLEPTTERACLGALARQRAEQYSVERMAEATWRIHQIRAA